MVEISKKKAITFIGLMILAILISVIIELIARMINIEIHPAIIGAVIGFVCVTVYDRIIGLNNKKENN